jgi:hypothetical protein
MEVMELCDIYVKSINKEFHIEQSMSSQVWKTHEQEDNEYYLGSTLVAYSSSRKDWSSDTSN